MHVHVPFACLTLREMLVKWKPETLCTALQPKQGQPTVQIQLLIKKTGKSKRKSINERKYKPLQSSLKNWAKEDLFLDAQHLLVTFYVSIMFQGPRWPWSRMTGLIPHHWQKRKHHGHQWLQGQAKWDLVSQPLTRKKVLQQKDAHIHA